MAGERAADTEAKVQLGLEQHEQKDDLAEVAVAVMGVGEAEPAAGSLGALETTGGGCPIPAEAIA